MILFHPHNEFEKPLTSATQLRTLIPHVAALVSFSLSPLRITLAVKGKLFKLLALRIKEKLYWIVNNRDAFIVFFF